MCRTSYSARSERDAIVIVSLKRFRVRGQKRFEYATCGCVLFKSAEKKSPFSIISVHTWRRGRTFIPNFYGVLYSQASFQRYVGWISLQNFVTVLYGNFPRFSPNSRAKTESVLLKASKRNDRPPQDCPIMQFDQTSTQSHARPQYFTRLQFSSSLQSNILS